MFLPGEDEVEACKEVLIERSRSLRLRNGQIWVVTLYVSKGRRDMKVQQLALRGTAQGVSADSARVPQGGAGHEHGGDEHQHREHHVRDRQWVRDGDHVGACGASEV